MAEKKKILCRVCGKQFTPCAYCQDHADVFRWRNFACSIKCAEKYVNETIEYRIALKNKPVEVIDENIVDNKSEQVATTKKKNKKKITNDESLFEDKNNETE